MPPKIPRNFFSFARCFISLCVFSLVILNPVLAQAYIGPGAGISAIGALWAVVLALVFAIGGLVIWPLRAMMRRKKAAATTSENVADSGTDTDTTEDSSPTDKAA